MLNLKVKLMSQRKIRKNHEKLGKGEGKGSNKGNCQNTSKILKRTSSKTQSPYADKRLK